MEKVSARTQEEVTTLQKSTPERMRFLLRVQFSFARLQRAAEKTKVHFEIPLQHALEAFAIQGQNLVLFALKEHFKSAKLRFRWCWLDQI